MATTLNAFVAATPAGAQTVVFTKPDVNITTGLTGDDALTLYTSSQTVPTYGALSGYVDARGVWQWDGTGLSKIVFFELRAWYVSGAELAIIQSGGEP